MSKKEIKKKLPKKKQITPKPIDHEESDWNQDPDRVYDRESDFDDDKW